MNGLLLIVGLTLSQAPAVQVSTLNGEQVQGSLEAFSDASVVIKSDDKQVSVPFGEVLLIRTTAQPVAPAADSPIEVRLADATRLRVKSITSAGSTAKVVHGRLGQLQIPTASIVSVRMVASDPKVETEWNQLLERSIKSDLLAIRKGDVLDHLNGVIGSLSDSKLQFQMDGEDIEVKREKVFGLIYAKRESSAKKSIAQMDLASGDRLSLKQVRWSGTAWNVRLVTGLELEIAPDLFQTLDFSLGKVSYLSDMDPRGVEHTQYFKVPVSFTDEYRRDKDFDGNRISLGEKTYAKGLAIRSRTSLKYRLGSDYRRFQAIMGIGDEVPVGNVDVTLKGDNKVLFKASVNATETNEKGTVRRAVPQLLDVDVSDVVELEIFVDFGSDKHYAGDRLYLANARVVK